jgi:ElaB/YqjD/DUF883 family membrane-anchored ribosome-binding protein
LNNLKSVTESAAALGTEARESIEELGRTANRKIDDARDKAAAALHTAADSVRTNGRKSSMAIDDLAASTAARLDATGAYVEDHDLNDAITGLRRFGSRHLAGSLLAAAAVGFLAGTALRRASRSCASVAEGS